MGLPVWWVEVCRHSSGLEGSLLHSPPLCVLWAPTLPPAAPTLCGSQIKDSHCCQDSGSVSPAGSCLLLPAGAWCWDGAAGGRERPSAPEAGSGLQPHAALPAG